MQKLKQIIKRKLKSTAVVVSAAAFLMGANPAFARIDELIVNNASYITPPPASVSVMQSLYEVKTGETLIGIARKNMVSVETLAAANNLENPDSIRAGQVLRVPGDCVVHFVKRGETLTDIAGMYRVDVSIVAARNGLSDINNILAGQQLFIPHVSTVMGSLPSRGILGLPLSWPVVGAITSVFGIREGKKHEGIDIAVEEGTPIRASAPGRVVFAGPRGTYGLAVIIDHGGGVRTLYAHCSRILVSEGSSVGTETVIALAGNTGRSNGPHLHLEVLQGGIPVDPLPCLDQWEIYDREIYNI